MITPQNLKFALSVSAPVTVPMSSKFSTMNMTQHAMIVSRMITMKMVKQVKLLISTITMRMTAMDKAIAPDEA